MFERFTERARHVVVLAQVEARELRFGHIGTEALLLGLLREEEGLACRVLGSFDITLERARAEITKRVSSGEEPVAGAIPFTPRAKSVLERATNEALALGHNYVGTEHLLLGVASVDEGDGMNALRALGVDSAQIHEATIRLLESPSGPEMSTAGKRARGAGRQRKPIVSHQHEAVRVRQGADVARLMMSAAARALEDGRTEVNASDLLIALARGQSTGPLLAELGADETAIRDALTRLQRPGEPPEPSAAS